MKVIARKAHVKLIWEIIAMVVGFLICTPAIIFSSPLWREPDTSAVIWWSFGIVVYLAFMVFFAFKYIRYYKTPEEILFYDGERIVSSKGNFLPSEIEEVKYTLATWKERRYGPTHYYSWGKLRLKVGKKKLRFYYVEDVKKVYILLKKLMEQNNDKEIK